MDQEVTLKIPLLEGDGHEREEGGCVEEGYWKEQRGHAAATSKTSISFGALVLLIYYNVGVPFGDEEAIKAAGPFYVSLGFFVLLPVFWQLPICLITAELATAYQDRRGSIAWVSEAFGDQLAFATAIWSLATSFLDNAMFPLISADFFGLEGTARWVFVYSSIAGLSYLAFRGSEAVARVEEAIFALTMLPLGVMVVVGGFHIDWGGVMSPEKVENVDWRLYLQIMFWTSTYWQKVASLGPEVKDCSKNFPRAIMLVTLIQAGLNGVIHLVAAGATDPLLYTEWEPGYLRHAADAIAGGRWLGTWLTIMAAISNSGSYLSEMSVTSQTLTGMSERGLLPQKLAEESQFGTHPWALGTIAAFIAASQPLDFDALVLVCNFLYTLQTLTELAAFYRLRSLRPTLPRPFRVPGGRYGAAVAVALPAMTLLTILFTVTVPAALMGSVLALASLISAHLVYSHKRGQSHLYTVAGSGQNVARGGGGGSLMEELVLLEEAGGDGGDHGGVEVGHGWASEGRVCSVDIEEAGELGGAMGRGGDGEEGEGDKGGVGSGERGIDIPMSVVSVNGEAPQ